MKFFKALIILFAIVAVPGMCSASTLSLSPNAGTFTVGDVFDVTLILNTQGKSVNAVDIFLSFPADKLQLVSPATGKSIIGIWTSSPEFDNSKGIVKLQGAIPGGINVKSGLISTLSFRVRSVGDDVIRFLDDSSVYLNDGLATDDLQQTYSGAYHLVLPPPAGPVVSSLTHPDQSIFYRNRSVSLQWKDQGFSSDGYSYILSNEPDTIPDDTSEGIKTSVSYDNLSDGIHYFHIKSLRGGAWGGATHFEIKIDTTPPADFPVDIIPFLWTTVRTPTIRFSTTDSLSVINHYEIKIVSLSAISASAISAVKTGTQERLFVETASPYVSPPLELGSYDVIVRAYDKAGNFREKIQRMSIVSNIFEFVNEQGLQIGGFGIAWVWLYIFCGFIILILGFWGFKIRRWHTSAHHAYNKKELPGHVKKQLDELKRYRQKYGSKTLLFILIATSFLSFRQVKANEIQLSPPVVTTISQNISNEETFYAGGTTDFPNTTVIIYLQNLTTGATLSETAESDQKGEWFYHYPTYLSAGDYLLWTQSKLGDQTSPPGPQNKLSVKRAAIQFGFSRLSYETIYLFVSIILLSAILVLVGFIVFHFYHGRKHHKILQKEVREAEESLRRGFAVLKHDIETELSAIRKSKFNNLGKEKETRLLEDLAIIQQRIGKEIWDVEKEI